MTKFSLPLILAGGSALAACTTTVGEPPADGTPSQPPAAEQCNADAVQSYVGKLASQQTGGEIVAKSGASRFRWGAPGSAWTMDYRTDRVNVRYDEKMVITEITCG